MRNELNILIEVAVKVTMQKFYEKGLLEKNDYADEVYRDFLLIDEINEINRPDVHPNK